ncbi:MAG: WYL domain-containing protein [Meiothermus sp.]|uniref:helix-turn-helix transcriptional regulator n=3 Tax=Meiothermus sp. TaxID=1955249 RepID=UPI0025D829F3|nr:WYL domain-containing protein [Meiothermus sp.]MCS7194446.1 WYL domain-containing protein [Meiothermus sp.]MDW8091990.1 WYL domain-containing protein [Meiothermus sp.]MDW8481392.1 WYL domain-containing protein [Meiothermus sp.]
MAKGASHKKAQRLLEARELLLARPYTAQELARALGVHKRTALRYLLEDLGAIETERDGRSPRYQLLQSQELSPVEALVTHSALRLLYHHTPGYEPTYFSALNKLARRLPMPAQELALKSTRDLQWRSLIHKDQGLAMATVAEAWFRRQLLEFDYLKPGGSGRPRKNLLEVYFLEVSRTNLGMYVIGYERGYHKALRTYKLSRMRRVRLVGEPGAYTIPKDFDPREYLSNAWGVIGSSGRPPVEVRLLFRPEAVYRVEEGGYPNLQIIQKHPDGSLEVSITTGTDNDNFPLELLSWVQSWGARVEVLAPENLRRRWLEEARQVAAICDRI